MIARTWRAALLGTALLAAGGAADPADPVVAQRGDVVLTASAVRDLVRSADPADRDKLEKDPAALAQFVRGRLLQSVLLNEARAQKWDERPEIAARAERAREGVIVDSFVASLTQADSDFPSEAEVQAAYDANKQRFMLPRQYHLAQIFVAVPSGAAKQTEDDAQKRINDLHQQAGKKGVDFADLARKQSEDRAAGPKGGDLGWLREDQLVPAIKNAASGLQEGAIGDPVRMPDGWHLLKLLGTRPAGPAPLADVRDTLVASLRQEQQTQNARAYVNALLQKNPIQLDEIQLSHVVTRQQP